MAVFMVVGIHTMAYIRVDGGDRGVLEFLFQMIAVPIFFLVDGVLFAKSFREGRSLNYKKYITDSAQRLLIPWVVFNLLYLSIRAVMEYSGFLSESLFRHASPSIVLELILTSRVSHQMYFLLSLFLIRILAVLWFRLSRLSPLSLLLIWGCYTSFSFLGGIDMARVFSEGLDPFHHMAIGIRFYLLGMVLYVYQSFLEEHSGLVVAVCAVLTVLLEWSAFPGFLVQIPYLAGVYVAFMKYLGTECAFSHMGRHTMGVYLIHAPLVVTAVSMVANRYTEGGSAVILVATFAAFVASLFLAKIVGSVRVGRLILGER